MILRKTLDWLLVLLSLGLYMVFRRPIIYTGIAITVMLYRTYLAYKEGKRAQYWAGLVSTGLLVLGIVINRYLFSSLAALVTGLISFGLLFSDSDTKKASTKKHSFSQNVFKLLGQSVIGIALLSFIGLNVTVIYPKSIVQLVGVWFGQEVVKPESVEKNSDGTVYYRNLTYKSDYSNNKLDIFTAPNAKGTIFYVHGGGFVGDDKSAREDYLFQFVKEGYNAVSINYALAPEVSYLAAQKQANEALKFVVEKADDYGIDPNKIVLAGDSAGGQIAGQLANILTNSAYAKEVGILPANQETDFIPKGYIAISSLTHAPNYSQTGFFLIDWIFDAVGRDYFGTTDVVHSKAAMQASVRNHVTSKFPATFVTDGNIFTFTKDSKQFVESLKAKGIAVDSYIPEKSEAILPHIFEVDVDNDYAKKVHQEHLAFLEDVL